jgi:hypothetical protein
MFGCVVLCATPVAAFLLVFFVFYLEPAAHFYIIRTHRYERLCRSALDLVVLSPGFFEGTTKNSAIKTKPWRVANASPDSKILGGIPWEPGEEAGNTRIRQ